MGRCDVSRRRPPCQTPPGLLHTCAPSGPQSRGIDRLRSIRLPLLPPRARAALRSYQNAPGSDSREFAPTTFEAHLSSPRRSTIPPPSLPLLPGAFLWPCAAFPACAGAASINAVKAPQPIDSLIEYHNYQQTACTAASVKNH